MSLIKKLAVGSVALAAVLAFALTPVSANASGLTSSQIQAIENLVASFGASASVIANVNAALTGSPVPTTSTSGSVTSSGGSSAAGSVSSTGGSGSGTTGVTLPYCPQITSRLSLGSTGAQVTALQNWLINNGFTGVSATGTFDAATQAAVEQFQAQQGIVSSGSPATTGYGAVGPATRTAFINRCGGSGVNPIGVSPQPVLNGISLTASPASGAAPLTVEFHINTAGISATSGTGPVSIDFGDNKTNIETLGDGSGNSCGDPNTSECAHTYQAPGTYIAHVYSASGNMLATTVVTVTSGISTTQVLSALCAGSPYNSGTPGISWSSHPIGGSGTYTYQWTLSNDVTGTGISGTSGDLQQQNVLATYGSTGIKNASVVISDGSTSVTATCSATIGSSSTGTPTSLSASVTPSTVANAVNTAQLKWNISNAPSGSALEIGISGAALDANAGAGFSLRNIVSPLPINNTLTGVFSLTAPHTFIPFQGTINFLPNYGSSYLPISGPVNFTVLDASGNVLAQTSVPLTITAFPTVIDNK